MNYQKPFLFMAAAAGSTVLCVLLISASWNNNESFNTHFEAVKTYFNCTTDQFVTFNPGGRLGNRICEYVHLLLLNETHRVTVANHPSMYDSLHRTFPNMSMKQLDKNCLKTFMFRVNVHEADAALSRGLESSLLVEGGPCDLTGFNHLRPLWLRELRFSKELEASATKRLRAVANTFQKQLLSNASETKVTLVGVHVRRNDIQLVLDHYHNGKLLPPAYYEAAFDYHRKTFGSVVFVVLTEPKERKWCLENLAQNVTDVVVMDDGASAEQDLALLASFSHFVYSHGTFGLWGILLAHELKTIAYPAQERNNSKLNRYAPYASFDIISKNWTDVDFVKINFE